MATIDLTNDITPKHRFRPVKPNLADLRAAIAAASGGGAAYPAAIRNKMNRNDLIFALRNLGVAYPS